MCYSELCPLKSQFNLPQLISTGGTSRINLSFFAEQLRHDISVPQVVSLILQYITYMKQQKTNIRSHYQCCRVKFKINKSATNCNNSQNNEHQKYSFVKTKYLLENIDCPMIEKENHLKSPNIPLQHVG